MTTMKMIELSPEELKLNDVMFNNENDLSQEAFTVELAFSPVSNTPFHLWVNGELKATFKTFQGLVNRALPLIATNNLEKVL